MKNAADLIVDRFYESFKALGFAFFHKKHDYDLTLCGVRSPETNAGYFDDLMCCFYRVEGRWRAHFWSMTTDPGRNLLVKPMNEGGCGILVSPQQMRSAYCVGKHKGRQALIQRGGRVRLWRDNTRDGTLDWGRDMGYPSWAGINIHNTTKGEIADTNMSASAACQVFPLDYEHRAMMSLARRTTKLFGKWITYTIIDTKHLVAA